MWGERQRAGERKGDESGLTWNPLKGNLGTPNAGVVLLVIVLVVVAVAVVSGSSGT